MKKYKIYILLITVLTFTALLTTSTTLANAPNEIRNIFPDPIFAELVATNLDMDVEDMVTDDDLLDILVLNFNENERVTDFTGIERLENLEYLFLDYHGLTDLTPFAGLSNLVQLNVEGNDITDLTPLAGLTNLEVLQIGWNPISNVDALLGLPQLRVLSMFDTDVTDLSSIAQMTQLEELDLTGIHVIGSDVNVLSALVNLRSLNLTDIEIYDLSFLSNLTMLEELILVWNTHFYDLTPLAPLTNLVRLTITNSAVADITVLELLTNLEVVNLLMNEIEDVTPLGSLSNLQQVNLSGNRITDIRPLSGLNLEVLDVSAQHITLEEFAVIDVLFPFVIYDLNGQRVPLEVGFGNGTPEEGGIVWHDRGFNGVDWSLNEGGLEFSGSMFQFSWEGYLDYEEDEEPEVEEIEWEDEEDYDPYAGDTDSVETDDVTDDFTDGILGEDGSSEDNRLPATGYAAGISAFMLSAALVVGGLVLGHKQKKAQS